MISPSAQAGKFVISLCSVAAPITIPQPRSPQLMRYRFFLHTCWEEGVRRHRLYMGYFATREDAVKWLGTLRKIYPSAFVSVAPEAQTLTNTQVMSLLDQPQSQSAQRVAAGTGASGHSGRQPPEARDRSARRRSGPTLEDTVAALKVDTVDINNDDDLPSSTGVRHLRIEVQNEAPRVRSQKRSGSRKP